LTIDGALTGVAAAKPTDVSEVIIEDDRKDGIVIMPANIASGNLGS